MAALGDVVLGGYLYPACVLCSYRCLYPAAAAKGKSGADEGGSRPRGGGYPPVSSFSDGAASSSFPGHRQLAAAEYVHSYHRAQLMALLSQVGPRRASTRDAAVQMNPRRDVSVQCSLGRRARESGPSPDPEGAAVAGGSCPASPQRARRRPEQDSPPSRAPRPVRFLRTLAVYSPVTSRCLATLLEGAEAAAGEQRPGKPETERGPPPARPRGPEEGDGPARKVSQRPQPEEDEAQAAVPASREQPPPLARVPDAAGERSSSRSPQPGKERLRFQVYYKQFCRTCQKSYNPYRVEDITCQNCKQTRCSCPVKLRHVDPKRPHRQDLCGRCKGKRLSCDSTFSFKYII
ncbi:zygote arrest protein 1 isoform X3 [Cervus elaphus]|uniref:zygote arrest protein 1 isoform X3 n=1 Tax=Cervus elaphus TaxID=9860 RepID=UPI001CC3132E|nr:zygote arrest protein 1 isoform X3 [Cervus elaphus]